MQIDQVVAGAPHKQDGHLAIDRNCKTRSLLKTVS
jgi:hypothetical protein